MKKKAATATITMSGAVHIPVGTQLVSTNPPGVFRVVKVESLTTLIVANSRWEYYWLRTKAWFDSIRFFKSSFWRS